MVSISLIESKPSDWNITSSPDGTPISYKTNTGVHCNVIPVESLEYISPKPDHQLVTVKLSAYNGLKISEVGKYSLALTHKNNSFKVSSIVVDSDLDNSWIENKRTFTTHKKNLQI